MQLKRVFSAVVVLVLFAVVAAVAFIAGSRIQQGRHPEVGASAPPPSQLVSTVESSELSERMVLRGVVTHEDSTALRFSPGQGGDMPILTDSPLRVDDVINAGDVVAEIGGRPVFVFSGDIPAYRDLGVGSVGDDVLQVQRWLADEGWYEGELDGIYGPLTQAAVGSAYETNGYLPPASRVPEAELLAANRSVDDASRAFDAAVKQSAEAAAEARIVLDRAVHDRQLLLRQHGTAFPVAEYVVLNLLPMTIVGVAGDVGSPIEDVALELASESPQISVPLSPTQTRLVSVGSRAEVTVGSLADTLTASVVAIVAETSVDPSSPGNTPDRRAILAVTSVLASDLVGSDVTVAFEISSSGGAVLHVPITAIYSSPDGNTFVQLRHPDGAVDRVDVTVGLTIGGRVELIDPGQLDSGDEVVVGGLATSGTSDN